MISSRPSGRFTERRRRVMLGGDRFGRGDGEACQRGTGLHTACLGKVDPLVGQVDLELAIARELHGQPDRERTPLPWPALQGNVAAEELRQLADDRESE